MSLKRSKPLRRRSGIARKTRLRAVSTRRKGLKAIYLIKRAGFLIAHPICQVSGTCRQPSHDVHHVCGRLGTNYLDETTWLAVCRPCHDWIHAHPDVARGLGLLR